MDEINMQLSWTQPDAKRIAVCTGGTGILLNCASRGDRVGLNQMLREGASPNVQDYDYRTAMHLAASGGHASIVELLIEYGANVNLKDRWNKTPLTDAKLYGHKDICRILESNGGTDAIKNKPSTLPNKQRVNEATFDLSEINFEDSLEVEQGQFGLSHRVKWRGTWVVKTIIKRKTGSPILKNFSSKDLTLLRELRHPSILQFLGAILMGEDLILITEYLSGGPLSKILNKKNRFNNQTAVRHALDLAKGLNYLHRHRPDPIVHNYLDFTNLLQDEGGQLKIAEYWVQMLYHGRHPVEENGEMTNNMRCHTTHYKKDIRSFARIFHQMLEGPNLATHETEFEPNFKLSRCSGRIRELIQNCFKEDYAERYTFDRIIGILEEESTSLARRGCPAL